MTNRTAIAAPAVAPRVRLLLLLLAWLPLPAPELAAQDPEEVEPEPTEQRHVHLDREIRLALDWLRRHQQPDGRWTVAPLPCCGDPSPNAGPRRRSDLELSSLAVIAILGDRGWKERLFRRCLERATSWMMRELEAEPPPFGRGDRVGHSFALAALVQHAVMGNSTARLERLAPLLAAIDRERPAELETEALYAWVSLKRTRELFLDVQLPPSWSEEIRATELLLTAAPEDTDRLALVALTRIYANESPRSSGRLEALDELFRDERCPRLEQDLASSPLAVLLRGEVAFQHGGAAYLAWRAAHQAPLRSTQAREGCARGAWLFSPAGEEPLHPLERTVLSALILEVYFCYC